MTEDRHPQKLHLSPAPRNEEQIEGLNTKTA